jgi:mRNA interferase MazF
MNLLPRRGEVWLADLGMAAKVRVPFSENDYALFHVVPHTTTVRGSQFEVFCDVSWLLRGVFNMQGSQSVPRKFLLRRLGALPETCLGAVEQAMRRWLAL